MRRSLFLLIAAILAFVRVFALGVAAVALGMGDSGGASSALLRVFQLYGLLFVYLLFLQYRKSESRQWLQTPSIVLAAAAPVLTAMVLISLVRHASDTVSADLARTVGSILVLLFLDILVLGLLALDALTTTSRTDRKPAAPAADRDSVADSGSVSDDARHEVL